VADGVDQVDDAVDDDSGGFDHLIARSPPAGNPLENPLYAAPGRPERLSTVATRDPVVNPGGLSAVLDVLRFVVSDLATVAGVTRLEIR